MDVTLVVVGGKTNTSKVKLSLPTTVGRGQECKLKLPQPLVSRRHCELFEQDGLLYVRDLGSMNGTYVGSERVDQAVLPHEGLLTVGAVTFRAIYDLAASDSLDDATQSDLGAETKADLEQEQLVDMAGPMDPVDIDGFDQYLANQNDLTQRASTLVNPDGPTIDAADVALPPVVGEKPEDVARTD